MARLQPAERRARLAELIRQNAEALHAAIAWCADHGIGAFRVNSQILPLKTHPRLGYAVDALPDGTELVKRFRACGQLARARGIRLSFHPDQFVVLNALKPEVVESSLREIEDQAEVAEWIGADVVNIHGGGVYGDKAAALDRLCVGMDRLSARARARVTLENDDRSYTPQDLLPVCRALRVPLVYDAHHHRCLPDGLSVEEATRAAAATWGRREPLFHLSSPLLGWKGPKPERHHDFINPRDVPRCWLDMRLTVDIEAKAKEHAVLRLRAWLQKQQVLTGPA